MTQRSLEACMAAMSSALGGGVEHVGVLKDGNCQARCSAPPPAEHLLARVPASPDAMRPDGLAVVRVSPNQPARIGLVELTSGKDLIRKRNQLESGFQAVLPALLPGEAVSLVLVHSSVKSAEMEKLMRVRKVTASGRTVEIERANCGANIFAKIVGARR